MQDLKPLLMLFGPLTAVCGLLFWMGSKAQSQHVRRALRISAALWYFALGLIYLVVMISIWTCDGNIIFGYVNCRGFGIHTSDAALALFIFGTLGGIIYGAVLLLACGILEWRYRRR